MINDFDEFDYKILIDKVIKKPKGSKPVGSIATTYFQFINYAPPSCPPLPPGRINAISIDGQSNSFIFFIEEFKGRYYIVERLNDTSELMQSHILEYITLSGKPDSREKMNAIIDWKIKTLEDNFDLHAGDYISHGSAFFKYYQDKGYFDEFDNAFTKQQKERLLTVAQKKLDKCISEKSELGYELEELLPMLYHEYPEKIENKLLLLLDTDDVSFYSLYDVRGVFEILLKDELYSKEPFYSELKKMEEEFDINQEKEETEYEMNKRKVIHQYVQQLKKSYLETKDK